MQYIHLRAVYTPWKNGSLSSFKMVYICMYSRVGWQYIPIGKNSSMYTWKIQYTSYRCQICLDEYISYIPLRVTGKKYTSSLIASRLLIPMRKIPIYMYEIYSLFLAENILLFTIKKMTKYSLAVTYKCITNRPFF